MIYAFTHTICIAEILNAYIRSVADINEGHKHHHPVMLNAMIYPADQSIPIDCFPELTKYMHPELFPDLGKLHPIS